MSKDKTQILLENHEVFEETLNEFSSKSYDLASVNEIIKNSKYNKGSFYYRFKDKYELYLSLLDYVFVQQIDLYNRTGFSLITNDDSQSILKSMYQNLIDLYHTDQRFYQLILMFYNEDDAFINQSLDASVGSLYQRYISKLSNLGYFSNEQMIIIESLYKNFPILKVLNQSIDFDALIGSLVGQTVKQNQTEDDASIDVILDDSLVEPINYLMTDKKLFELETSYFNLIEFSKDESALIRKLKLKTLTLKFGIRKILKKYLKKPIFNHLAIQHLLDGGLDEIEDDIILRQCLYALVYAIIDLKEYIIIDHITAYLNENQVDLLMNKILPINGKLSKIIIIDSQLLYASSYPFNAFYYYDDVVGLKKYHIDDFKTSYAHKIHCEYVLNDYHQHRYFDDLDSVMSFRKNNDIKILTLKHLHKLTLEDLRGDVS